MASSLNEYLKRKVRGGRIKKDNKDDEGSSRRKGRTCGVDLPCSNGATKSATTKPLQARKHPDPNECASPRRESLDLSQLKPSGPPARTNSSSASTLATSHSSLASSYSSLPATSSSSPVRKAPRRKVSRPASFSTSASAPLSPRQERRAVTTPVSRGGGGGAAGVAPKRNSTSPLKATSPRRSTPKATVAVPSNVSPNRAPSGGTSPPLASKVTPTNGSRAPRPVVPSFVSSPSLNSSTPIIKRSSLRLSRSASVTGKSSAVATGAPRSPRAAPLRASSAQLGVSPRKPGGAGGGGARVPLRSASSQSVGAPNRPLVQPKRSTMSEATLRSEPSYTKRQPIPPGKSGGRMPLPPPSASGYGSDATSVQTEPSPRLRAMSTTSGAIGMRRPVPGRTAAGAPRSHHARSFSSSNQTTYSSPPPTTTTSLGAKLNAQKNKLAGKQQQQQAGGNGGDITDDLLDDYLDIMSEYGETSSVTGW